MYSYDTIVRYSDTHGKMTADVGTVANYFQDCAILESENVGIGIEYLKEHNRAWFLISWQMEIGRYPRLAEKISVRTWAYDFKGSMGYRNIEILDANGTNIASAASQWSYIDTQTMRLTRIEENVGKAYILGEKLDMEYAPRKIALLDGMTVIDKRRVMNYQIDSNSHMNNEAYIELALEYMDKDIDIKSVRAEYKKQLVRDDVIIVKRAASDCLYQIVFSDESDNISCIVEFK